MSSERIILLFQAGKARCKSATTAIAVMERAAALGHILSRKACRM